MQTKILMAIAFALAILLVTRALIKRDQSDASQLNFDDLLIGEDGKISKAAAVMLGAFSCTTWVIVYLALMGKMDVSYFAAYLAAWVTPTVTKLIVNRATPPGG